MGKLLVNPKVLAEVRALARARATAEEPGHLRSPGAQAPVDPLAALPPRIRAFWLRQDGDTPPWRQESAEQRAERLEATERGAWCG